MIIRIPYGYSYLRVEIPEERIKAILTPKDYVPGEPEQEIVRYALHNPIDSPSLKDMVKSAKSIVILTSDHTRPLPSHITMPLLLSEIRSGNPAAHVTILIATGLHRPMTHEEQTARFGEDIVNRERIVIHNADDEDNLVYLGELPSGAPLWVNKLAAEADLLIAEGFIEPHFFAGFSGGRKSVLPGVAGRQTILFNHCATFIDHEKTIPGMLEGNIIHTDMKAAAQKIGLAFILNVALNPHKKIIAAFAGHPDNAFQVGASFVRTISTVERCPAQIVIASNGGYPLDQNLYQAVKGMRTAQLAAEDGGIIILAASCLDGIGGEWFRHLLLEAETPSELLNKIRNTPPNATFLDQWQVQVLARILQLHKVILVTHSLDPALLRKMHFEHAPDLLEALEMADHYTGKKTSITVIPDGVNIIIN